MTITVNGPNGVVINFPDGTDSATIDKAMRQAAGVGDQPKGFVENAADFFKSIPRGIVSGLTSTPNPSMAPGIEQEAEAVAPVRAQARQALQAPVPTPQGPNSKPPHGGFPDLIILFLPNDHSGGTRGEYPTPGAQLADNDLAFGRVVEAISHSRFWPETCLFAIEDDPQAGWDHVSGYRTTCYVVSPYTKRRQTVSTQYNQTSLVRTIELILGLPPMNQLDATATPMTDCFSPIPLTSRPLPRCPAACRSTS